MSTPTPAPTPAAPSLLAQLGAEIEAAKAAKAAPTTPLERKAAAATLPKKRSKLKRNLVGIGLVVFVVGLFTVQLIKQGGNLEDKERLAKLERDKEGKRKEDYDKSVINPEAVAAAAIANASVARPPQPAPGTAVPLPADADALLERDREKLDTAWRAIQSGQTARSAGTGTASTTASGTAEAAASAPGFVGYAAPKKDSTFSAAPAPAPAATRDTSGITPRPGEPPEATRARQQAAQLQADQVEQARLAGIAGAGPRPTRIGDANNAWLTQTQTRPTQPATTLLAKQIRGRHVIYAGTLITGVLEQGVDTSLPGKVRARVTTDVYDSRYGRYLVVPRGSLLIGEYRNSAADGQDRVLMAFDRLITPAGAEVALGGMTAADALGIGGVPGELETNLFKRLGIATLLAIEAAVIEKKVGPVGTVVAPGGTGSGQATSSAGGQLILQTGQQELTRQYAVPPKITIAAGVQISIIASESIEIPESINVRY